MQANNVQILVLDFGSQYTQLIARRLREYGVYTEIVPYFEKLDSIKAKNPKGIILSGGPASVYEKDAYKPDSAIFSLGIPILGICYGMQLIAQYFGGRVIKADAQEFGKAVLEIMESYADKDSKTSSYPTFQDVSQDESTQAPMSLSFTLFSHSKFPQILGAMLDLWEDSVRASHTFLTKQDIAEIKPEVKAALKSSQNIITATDKKDFLGFIGVEKNKIEMLFVASSAFRKGVGKALLKEALERYLKDYPYILVDCNEQNTQGLAFYESLGFEAIGKSAQDSAGRDFPIVHLQISKKRLQTALKSYDTVTAPILSTERTILRPYTQADFKALHEILSDEKTMYTWGHGFSKKESQEWLDKQLTHYKKYGFGIWAIIEKQSGKIIGNAGLNYEQICLEPLENKAQKTKGESKKIVEIGYLLHRDFWNKGYGSEAARMCVKYGFETLGLEEVYCLIKEDNLSSLKVAKKLSMQKVGEYLKPYKGKKINHLVFKLDKKVWQELENSATQGFKSCSLFKGVKQDSIVWMSHADKVESIPSGFVELARSGNTHYCAIADSKRKIYALQFHPEVVHSECGGQMLQNFAVGICGADTSWNMRNFAQNEIEKLRHIVYGSENVDLQNPAFITLKVAIKEKGKKQTIENLLQIWEDAVRATQQVSEAFITHRRKEIEKDYIAKAEEILIAKKAGEWLGFIALKNNEITLLFVAPQYFSKGIGKALLKEAINWHLYKFDSIILNSRKQALGFYQSLGFKKAGEPFCVGSYQKIMLTPMEVAREQLQRTLESPKDSLSFITLVESFKQVGKAQAIQHLASIWEQGARATHKDLSEDEIAGMREEILEAILKSKNLLIAQKNEEWLGFIAVEKNEIAMLFVAPKAFRKGVGKALLKEAFMRYLGAFEVIKVNSLEWALGFYQALGFTKTWGKPIPAGSAGEFSPELIPLSIARESLQKSLGLEAQGKCEKVRCAWATDKDEAARKLYENYHDDEWGEPLHDDRKLFEFLLLESFQAGLSWITILKKREGFRVAFDDFDYHKIAAYDESKIESLMHNEGIIRNRAKIEAAIINAKAFMAVQREFGSFDKYIWGFVGGKPIINTFESIADLPASTPLSDKIAKDLKKRGFKFVGTTTMYAFMQAIGMVNDHLTSCFKRHSACGDGHLVLSDKCRNQHLETTPLHTKRLYLRKFEKSDIQAIFQIYSDEVSNTYLPWFVCKNLNEAQEIWLEKYDKVYQQQSGYAYALCAKENDTPIGYVHLCGTPPYDLGYALRSEFWGKGYMQEALRVVLQKAKKDGFAYISATHDEHNLRSQAVIEAIGMQFQYSYKELWQPKNKQVVFCYYQLNFKENEPIYHGYAQQFEVVKYGCQSLNNGITSRIMTEAEAKQSSFLAQKPTSSKVLCAVSGGVDSSVVAALLYRAIGENLIPVFVDTGLLRKGEREAVEKMFRENLKVPLITADASELFLSRLKGVVEPEKKRKIIGETFIEVFEKEAKKHNAKGEIKFLAQGTLYPDVIESVSVKGPSKTIKSHHNVGGLPEWMKFELIEPLRELFKDEVRVLGRELGMPESMLMRHPFPGPGLAIRIMGEVNKADLDLLREADSIFIDELRKQGNYDKVWQAFCVLLNVRSVGVMGDNRTYDNTICVRAVEAIDGMTATFAHLPHDFLESVSNRIINEVEGINRVVYDITSKPPGTIEWE